MPQAPQHGLPAVCILGCRPGSAALSRRARAGAKAFSDEGADVVVACGGRSWDGVVEADEIARLLTREGIPDQVIVRERVSQDTLGNAAESARILSAKPVVLVTCSWHLPRARLLFERAGLRVVRGVGAPPPSPSLLSRVWWRGREKLATWKDILR